MRYLLVCSLAFVAPLPAIAADGDLDTSFGSGGKVRLPQAGGYHGTWMPMDVAVQSTGKIIISGWTDLGSPNSNTCFVLRLNVNGSLDTTFGNANGLPPGYASYSQCRNTSVVVRSDDRIVAADPGYGYTPEITFISQFTANGTYDATFNTFGNVELNPSSGDTAVVVNRIALDGGGNVIAAGSYSESGGGNDFYLARVSANGSAQTSKHYSSYFSSTSVPNSDIAYDVAVAADGSFYVAGTTKSMAGDLNCALSHNRYDTTFEAILTDNTFSGGSSNVVLAKDYGDNNDDYCFALALQPHDTVVLGGQSSTASWQTATLTTQGADGALGTRTNYKFVYDQINGPFNSDVDTVKRVVVEPYDHYPLLIGSGPNHTVIPSRSYDLAVARFSGPSTPDTSFNAASFGSQGFALYDVGSTNTVSNLNTATSAVLWHGRLIIVGTAQDAAGGTDIVALRLAPFDGIFKDGFEG
jgi:uncharacterized delta-60 repeat protein